MAGTFSCIYIHIVFGVKYRDQLIHASWEDELFAYITRVIQNKGQKVMAINGMPDHIHILIGMKPNCCISDLVREVKKSSNKMIAEKGFCRSSFKWQGGFGAFSCDYRTVGKIINYVRKQKEHHRTTDFRREYTSILNNYDIDFKDEYLTD